MTHPRNVEELLRAVAYRRIDVEHLLDTSSNSWIRFDPEIGYVPSDTVMKDGVDGARATYSHGSHGERRLIAHAGMPCRVNTYGDSFTQCQQVSDGETWQERLAAHFGEPVRNFGCGGYSVVSAVRRARRMEATAAAAPFLIVNCFTDDHIRNLDAARWIRTAWNDRDRPADVAYPLHGLPWSHLRYDLDAGTFVHRPGRCATPGDLLALADKEAFVEAFRDDQIARLFVLQLGGEARTDDLEALADALGLAVDLRNTDTRREDARRLHLRYGVRSTVFLLTEFAAWCRANDRRLLILTSYCMGTLAQALAGSPRHDQEFIDWLAGESGLPWVDAVEIHRRDFARTSLGVEEYVAGHYIKAKGAAVFGHYTPMANMFYAFGMKDAVAAWLDPAPPAYRD